MNNLIELYEFLDGCDSETLLLKITELIKTLNDQFVNDSDFRIQNHLNNVKNLNKMVKHQFKKEGRRFEKKKINLENSGITLGTSFIDSSYNTTPSPDKIVTPVIDKYKNMDSGDINFVRSIIPYDKNYIRFLCREGILPFEKPKGKYIFSRSKVEEWKKQHGSEHKKELLSIGKRIRSGEAKKNLIKTI
jgi:hypothetical protein